MIKAILFDLGGVILNKRIEEVLESMAGELEIEYRELLKIFKKYKFRQQTDKIFDKIFTDTIKKTFHLSQDIHKIWVDTYERMMDVNTGSMAIVNKLKGHYKLGIISNISSSHAALNRARGLLDHFDPVILSSEVGVHKPQPEIFQIALDKLELKPEECLFVDDRIAYTKTPLEMGFQVMHLKKIDQLKE